jgi:glyoxylase-like metal-dependent hydrolase (beta-lactamase superfamily II)
MHQNDKEIANNLPTYCQMFGLEVLKPPKITNFISDENSIVIDDYAFNVIYTPGHTPGSISYKIGNNIFVGDTLFNNSIGRTDLPGGSFSILVNSIKNKLFLLDDNMKVFCGHGNDTTIGYEKKYNIFLK